MSWFVYSNRHVQESRYRSVILIRSHKSSDTRPWKLLSMGAGETDSGALTIMHSVFGRHPESATGPDSGSGFITLICIFDRCSKSSRPLQSVRLPCSAELYSEP